MRPHRRQPTRLPRPWDSPGKNTGVGCHFLLQCMKVKSFSRVRLFATPWTAAYQAPLSMGFSRQECWSGLPLPSPKHVLLPSNFKTFCYCYKYYCIEHVELIFTAKFPLKNISTSYGHLFTSKQVPILTSPVEYLLEDYLLSHFARVNAWFSILIILELQH